MQTLENKEQIKAKLVDLRTRFNKLKNTCQLQHISRETLEHYKKQIESLEARLN